MGIVDWGSGTGDWSIGANDVFSLFVVTGVVNSWGGSINHLRFVVVVFVGFSAVLRRLFQGVGCVFHKISVVVVLFRTWVCNRSGPPEWVCNRSEPPEDG
jgi:hypothetical protein